MAKRGSRGFTVAMKPPRSLARSLARPMALAICMGLSGCGFADERSQGEHVFCMPHGGNFAIIERDRLVWWDDVGFGYGQECEGFCLSGFEPVVDALAKRADGQEDVGGSWQVRIDYPLGGHEMRRFSIRDDMPGDLIVGRRIFRPRSRLLGCEFSGRV